MSLAQKRLFLPVIFVSLLRFLGLALVTHIQDCYLFSVNCLFHHHFPHFLPYSSFSTLCNVRFSFILLYNTNFSTEAHLPTPRYGQYLTPAYNRIIRVVATMDNRPLALSYAMLMSPSKDETAAATAGVIWFCACVRYWPYRGVKPRSWRAVFFSVEIGILYSQKLLLTSIFFSYNYN